MLAYGDAVITATVTEPAIGDEPARSVSANVQFEVYAVSTTPTTSLTTSQTTTKPLTTKQQRRIRFSGGTADISIAFSSSEPCSTTCSRQGRACDEAKLQAVAKEFSASNEKMTELSNLLEVRHHNGAPEGWVAHRSSNQPDYFGFGCGSMAWQWDQNDGFLSTDPHFDGCLWKSLYYYPNSKLTCDNNGIRDGLFSGPRICVCK